MKRLLSLTVIVVLLCNGCQKKPEQTIFVGCIAPFSGDNARYGELVRGGVEIAVKEINDKGGIAGHMIKVIYEDSQMKPEVGVNAINKLIDADKVPAIIGGFSSGVTLAIAPVAERKKTILISPTATNYKIKDAGDYIFRVCPSDALQGKIHAELAFDELGARKAAILYENTGYGFGLYEVFKETFQRIGGQIVASEAFEEGATDLRTQLQKIKMANPDLIFMPSHYPGAALAVRQSSELGIKLKYLFGDGTFDQNFLKLAGPAAEGSVVSTMAWHTDEPIVERFRNAYRAKQGSNPDPFAALSYDAMMVLAKAIEKGGTSSEGIKQALYGVKYQGTTGVTLFNSFGEVSKPFDLYVVENGKFILMKSNIKASDTE